MSQYQVLARKYRPKNFAELMGQNHVANALANAIDTGRLHHAYLFTGTRGVGKTTIARILAKCLNCETGITSTPCGVCDTCVSVDSGRFIDLIEIDAASRTKVEDTRDLLENVPYAPTQGRYKVYLIDEVHMLSTHSFNALLKTLEEPPEFVKFILATTDPQKLPVTIVSRCLQFVLRPLSQELLHKHLSNILQAEAIPFTDQAIWQLAQSAKGSVRDALSLTDQAIAFGAGELTDNTVTEMLGLVDSLDVLTLVQDIFFDNRDAVAGHISRMRGQMVDANAMLDRLVDSFHQMALLQVLPHITLDMNTTQKQAFMDLANKIPADVLQLYYEIAAKSRDGIRLASTPMQALEMAILRLLAFRPLLVDEVPDGGEYLRQPTIISTSSNTIQSTDNHQAPTEHDDGSSLSEQVVDDTLHTDDAQNDTQNSTNLNAKIPPDTSDEIPTTYVDETSLTADTDEQTGADDDDENPLTGGNGDVITSNTHQPSSAGTDSNQQADITGTIPPTTIPPAHAVSLPDTDKSGKEQIRLMLKPAIVELSGEWTPEKWDYWIDFAKDNQLLDADELALTKNSLMIGQIDGECTLYVPESNIQVSLSYKGFCEKFCEQFGNAKLGELALMADNQDLKTQDTPNNRQMVRKVAVENTVAELLLQSKVIGALWQGGYIDQEAPSTITNLRLELD